MFLQPSAQTKPDTIEVFQNARGLEENQSPGAASKVSYYEKALLHAELPKLWNVFPRFDERELI